MTLHETTQCMLRQAPAAIVELRAGLDDDASEDTWHVAKAIADLSDNSADVSRRYADSAEPRRFGRTVIPLPSMSADGWPRDHESDW